MSSSDDINNLFARFGGRPENYHEIERADEARESESRWPLLSALNGHVGRPAAGGAPQRAEPSLRLPPTMPDPTRPDTVQAPAAAPAPFPAAPASPAAWPDGPVAPRSAPAQAIPLAAPAAEAAPPDADQHSRFQFIAPRPRGGVHPGHVKPSPPDTLAEAAARLAEAAPAPAPVFEPFRAAGPAAGSAAAPAAPWAEPTLARATPPTADSPFAAFRNNVPAAPPAAEPPASGTAPGSLASVFQRLSQPSSNPSEREPRGLFQRLVNR